MAIRHRQTIKSKGEETEGGQQETERKGQKEERKKDR